jgi:hypothetical protein
LAKINRAATLFIKIETFGGTLDNLIDASQINSQTAFKTMSWANDNGYFRWAHLWTDEGLAACIAIIKEKDRVYMENLVATTTAAKIKADVKEILEPLWAVQKNKKARPALKQLLPTRPTASAPARQPPARQPPITKVNRPCCVGCKKFQIHPNPPPHFTAEDMAHCCAFCRLTSGKRHGEHCTRQKA